MSEGRKWPHAAALEVAKEMVDALRPFVQRVKVVGSLRRRREEVGDIELLVEPQMQTADLLGGMAPDVASVRQILGTFGRIGKGADRYIRTELFNGIGCDTFLCHAPANWHVLLAIRTGPMHLGRWAVTRMHDFGLRCGDGRIISRATGREHEVTSEAGFFAAAGLPCLKPSLRDGPEAMRPLA